MKFRKKPVEVEAVQFNGENWYKINEFVGKTFEAEGGPHWGFAPTNGMDADGVVAVVWDKLHSTWVGVKPGQWIIKGVQGEFYPCDDQVFHDTYEEVK